MSHTELSEYDRKLLEVTLEKLMTVSADVAALVARIEALPIDTGAAAAAVAQRAEDVAAVTQAVSDAEAKEAPAVVAAPVAAPAEPEATAPTGGPA